MQVFIWKYIAHVSSNWHQEGGLVVVAPSLEAARRLANGTKDVSVAESEVPDIVLDLMEPCPEIVLTFPDAGCC